MSGGVVVTVLFFLALGLAWEGSVRYFGVRSYLVPSLSDIAIAGWSARDTLIANGLITLGEVAYGFALAVVLGAGSAVIVFALPIARATLYPLLVALQSIPKVGLAPLIVVWLGYGLESKVLMTFLFAFFPIVISTLGGLANVPPNLEEHFRSLGASRWTRFVRLEAPSALPSFVDGCKVAMPLAVIGAIVGEFVGSNDGLGNLIMLSTGASRTALTFAALLAVTALSLGLFYIIELLGKLVWWRTI
jgi:NitT/TauT family transport system permease protein